MPTTIQPTRPQHVFDRGAQPPARQSVAADTLASPSRGHGEQTGGACPNASSDRLTDNVNNGHGQTAAVWCVRVEGKAPDLSG